MIEKGRGGKDIKVIRSQGDLFNLSERGDLRTITGILHTLSVNNEKHVVSLLKNNEISGNDLLCNFGPTPMVRAMSFDKKPVRLFGLFRYIEDENDFVLFVMSAEDLTKIAIPD